MLSVALLDPTTLHGQQIREIWTDAAGADMRIVLLHTRDEEEHQLTEIDAAAALVPRLETVADLEAADAVIVTAPPGDAAHQVLRDWLATAPAAALIDLTQGLVTVPDAHITTGKLPDADPLRLQIAHPAVVAAQELLQPLASHRPRRLSLAVTEPASVLGASAVDELAEQSASRLRGEPSPEGFGGAVLAFNHIAVDASSLMRDLRAVLGDLQCTALRCLSGSFHGLVVHLTANLEHPVDADTLSGLWSAQPSLEMVGSCAQLDAVDQDAIRLSTPTLSDDGRSFSVTMMLDAMMIGGARAVVTALKAAASRIRS
jgi:aspartate-semialdehyde dehydrogenase